ncbi:MAG: hydrogenase maturation nickel metallochaperone HypA [Thermostichus sp. DG02_5_bins_236]
MHETDMTRALIQTLQDWWESQPERPRITHVHLIIGRFTCVEPVSLEFAYAVQTQATFLEGSQLVIRETPLIAYCHFCKKEYEPEIGQRYGCPTCGSPMEEIRSGRELKIDRIECLSEVS